MSRHSCFSSSVQVSSRWTNRTFAHVQHPSQAHAWQVSQSGSFLLPSTQCPPLLVCADFYYAITHWYARAASLSGLSFKYAKCALGNQHSFTDASLHGQLYGDALFVPHQILAKVEIIKAERARAARLPSGSAKHRVAVVTLIIMFSTIIVSNTLVVLCTSD